eukprot:GILK01005625.1.p1 GENE.GILK01005625.1~~GILK01005625.1.p1  ORF type:complete len:368 (-),score=21.23 GILK01005625.1:221-1213(-)
MAEDEAVETLELPAASIFAPTRFLIDFVAGGASGCVAAAVMNPLEVVKTRLQSSQMPVAINQPRFGLRTLTMLHTIYQKEGFRALWKGLTPGMLGVIPSRAFYYATYHHLKTSAPFLGIGDGMLAHFASAGCASMMTSTVTNPIWMIRTRMQLDRSSTKTAGGDIAPTRHLSARQTFNHIFKHEGIASLFKGTTASYLGAVETAVQWALFERLKLILRRRREQAGGAEDTSSSVETFGAMLASKLFASCIGYPHEVIRTRLREQNGDFRKYTGVWSGLYRIFKEEGLKRGLYRGFGVHCLRTVPNAAVTVVLYEYLKDELCQLAALPNVK